MELQAFYEELRAYEYVIKTMNCGLVAEDHDGILVFANQKMLDWLGYEEHEIVGKPINQLVPLVRRLHGVGESLRSPSRASSSKESELIFELALAGRFAGRGQGRRWVLRCGRDLLCGRGQLRRKVRSAQNEQQAGETQDPPHSPL